MPYDRLDSKIKMRVNKSVNRFVNVKNLTEYVYKTYPTYMIKDEINILIDVRKNAFSMNFTYTKNKLISYLDDSHINYLSMPELGIE